MVSTRFLAFAGMILPTHPDCTLSPNRLAVCAASSRFFTGTGTCIPQPGRLDSQKAPLWIGQAVSAVEGGFLFFLFVLLRADWPSPSPRLEIVSVHTLLAFSSIIFRVPSKRIASKPMMIYEEYRQHAMVFTARCFSVFAACILWPISEGRPAYVVPLVVMVHHLIADWITSKHGNGSTAVRATSDKATAVAISKIYKHVG